VVAQDRTLSEVVEAFGAPSVQIGGTNPCYPKTFAYATADRDDDLICVHLWNALADRPSGTGVQGMHPNRWCSPYATGRAPFQTPSRSCRKACTAGPAPTTSTRPGRSFASSTVSTPDMPAECSTLDDELAWAAEHQVTGILTEYPHGGAYDIAVREGRFTPSKHTTAPPITSPASAQDCAISI
jgi:hypothetical protein